MRIKKRIRDIFLLILLAAAWLLMIEDDWWWLCLIINAVTLVGYWFVWDNTLIGDFGYDLRDEEEHLQRNISEAKKYERIE